MSVKMKLLYRYDSKRHVVPKLTELIRSNKVTATYTRKGKWYGSQLPMQIYLLHESCLTAGVDPLANNCRRGNLRLAAYFAGNCATWFHHNPFGGW
jgi:hypothetical protein